MPAGASYVGRPSVFGNPWTIAGARDAGYRATDEQLAKWCCQLYREWLTDNKQFGHGQEEQLEKLLRQLPQLRGRQLVCWCALDKPCHADVLAELANQA